MYCTRVAQHRTSQTWHTCALNPSSAIVAFPPRRIPTDWSSGPQRLCRSQECLRQQLLKEDGLKAAPLAIGCLFMRRALSFQASQGKLLQMINSWVDIYATRASKPDTDQQSEKMVMQLSPLSPRTNADTCTHNTRAQTNTPTLTHTHSLHARTRACAHKSRTHDRLEAHVCTQLIYSHSSCTHRDMQACVHR